MKHFRITTTEQADKLRQFNATPQDPLTVGHIVAVEAGVVLITNWQFYPEADAVTFDQCMDIVTDRVTEEVLRELGGGLFWQSPHVLEGEKWMGFDLFAELDKEGCIEVGRDSGRVLFNGNEIPNPTATKIKFLTAILRGQ